jgi:hypothetical protein
VRTFVLVVGGLITASIIFFTTLHLVSAMGHEDVGDPLAFPAGVRRVVVSVDTGRVTVRGHDGTDVTGTRFRSIGLRRPEVSERVDGDTLRIEAQCDASFLAPWCGTSYELDVPRDVSLDLDSASGQVIVEGVTGDVRARSSAGRVRVDDVAGKLDLRSSAGRIEGSRLRSPSVNAQTSAGAVDLGFVAAPRAVTARSAAGHVRVEVPRTGDLYRVDAQSSVEEADIGVETSSTSDRVLMLSSSTGSVEVAYVSP